MQLTPHFTFHDAAARVPYLAALGVSHLYCSPPFAAVPGSLHGYDVVDPGRLRDELGGPAGFAALVAAVREHGMGLVVDIVPNHMALTGNAWWHDVLAHGAASRYAGYFDFGDEAWQGEPLLLPVLGVPYGEALLGGQLRLEVHEGAPVVVVNDDRRPVSADAVAGLLETWRAHGDHAADGAAALDAAVAFVNADPWRVHAVLEQQHYRLAWWRRARDESPYRRFFDINGLVGVRVEDPAVFEAVHALVATLIRRGDVAGLRVDHVDGLADPIEYLHRLRELAPTTPIVVEKILAGEERLPALPVAGTTGYEAGAAILRLLMAPRAEPAVAAFSRAFTRRAEPYPDLVRAARLTVVDEQLAGDVWRVAGLLSAACRDDVHLRDYSQDDCDALVREIVLAMPVYRTYLRPGGVRAEDLACLEAVFARVRREGTAPAALVDGVEAALREGGRGRFGPFVVRLQQLTTAVVAKGDEDTAGYRDVRLLALNEVGADATTFAWSRRTFHDAVRRWQRDMPEGLRSTATHDSKRGEDVRARLSVLTEHWPAWTARVRAWSLRAPRGAEAIDRTMEYYLYQTLVGAWPLSRERAHEHAVKAAREAKRHTRWAAPDAGYEGRLAGFVDRIYDDAAWTADIDAFVAALHPADWHKALSQTLIKLTIPGVPDLYQGTELWDHTLCDPDNRRPVDFDVREATLRRTLDRPASEVLAEMATGAPKLLVVQRTLALKARHPDLAPAASYSPIAVRGRRARQVLAFRRGRGVVVAAPLRTMAPSWADTTARLPAGTWRHAFTGDLVPGGAVDLEALFAVFPVALLAREAA